MTTRPEAKFRAGPVCATIWNNVGQTREGLPTEYKTVSFERSYKDKAGAWQTTSSLRLNDLPRAQVVLGKAYEYIVLQNKSGEAQEEAIAA
ncbi:hypothetical protein HYS47_03585 [Candidatus Woesearchaeota archaeon]|nr:hypothetical protein [Candidatus Woesearchaeota archaeon]